jgi:hypothetical protein
LHERLRDRLKHDCIVGTTHWESGGRSSDLPGAKPSLTRASHSRSLSSLAPLRSPSCAGFHRRHRTPVGRYQALRSGDSAGGVCGWGSNKVLSSTGCS